jgi:hypothetical protein
MKQFFTPMALIIVIACNRPAEYDASASILTDISLLASDSLQGREVGTEGERMAADYLANRMQAIGLKPAGTVNYFQDFFVKKSTNPHEAPSISANAEGDGITGRNVLGMIDNPSSDIIVIGAHFDHLGMGGISSLHRGIQEIHNGADDNASGTAALLHLAVLLKKAKLQSDILFFAISGEEQGLWGSNYFVKDPTVDLSKVKFMINMDMVGRLDMERGLAIYGTGTSPVWENEISKANLDAIKLTLKPSGTGPSDHTSFYLQDIPVLHFFTGQHEDYHKPTDDTDKINIGGIVQVAGMIERIILSLDAQKIEFTKTKDESEGRARFTVSLGVIPDYLYDGDGMRVDGVSEDKPAQKAGIQKGDVITQLGDTKVTDMNSYMQALSVFKKGEKTTVKLKRGTEEIELEVEF